MKQNLKAYLLVTVFTVALNLCLAAVMAGPVHAYQAGRDVMSDIGAGAYSSHAINTTFSGPVVAPGETLSVTLETSIHGFDCTGLQTSDITIDVGNWTMTSVDVPACTVMLTAGSGDPDNLSFTIAAAHVKNPDQPDSYNVLLHPSLSGHADTNLKVTISTDHRTNPFLNAPSSHELYYKFGVTPVVGDDFEVKFTTAPGYNCSALLTTDVAVSSGWIVNSIDTVNCIIYILADHDTLSNPLDIHITGPHLINPAVESNNYEISYGGTNLLSGYQEQMRFGMVTDVQLGTGYDYLDDPLAGAVSPHVVVYDFNTFPVTGDTFTVTWPTAGGFDCTGLTSGDFTLLGVDWTITALDPATCSITYTAGIAPDSPLEFRIAAAHIKNPTTANTYHVTFSGSAEPNPAMDIPVVITVNDGSDATHDLMSRLATGVYSSHTIAYKLANTPGWADNFTLSLQTSPGFDCSGLNYSDITVSNNWSVGAVSAASCTVDVMAGNYPENLIILTIADNGHVKNPATPGLYQVNFSGPGVDDNISVSIVDSDQVNVTGFVNTFMTFDIDTAVWGGTQECDYDTCLTYENGSAGSNYTVDLGELNSTWVNESNHLAVQHSDGNSGKINSVYLDLSTNAINGGTVVVSSANGALQGPGTNTINSVSDGETITANSGRYGFWLNSVQFTTGMITLNGNCVYSDYFCAFPKDSQELVFDSNSQPLDGGRIRMDVAAAAAYTDNPGSYTDTLTFIATATY